MLKYADKAEKRVNAPVAKPNPAPMELDSFFEFASKRYSRIIARLAE